MQFPVQVVFEHIKPVDYIDARVRDEAKKVRAVRRPHHIGANRHR